MSFSDFCLFSIAKLFSNIISVFLCSPLNLSYNFHNLFHWPYKVTLLILQASVRLRHRMAYKSVPWCKFKVVLNPASISFMFFHVYHPTFSFLLSFFPLDLLEICSVRWSVTFVWISSHISLRGAWNLYRSGFTLTGGRVMLNSTFSMALMISLFQLIIH